MTDLDKQVISACGSSVRAVDLAEVHRTVADTSCFDAILLGILSAATIPTIWNEAIERARSIYSEYRMA